MPQEQEAERPTKKKKSSRIAFDAGAVFSLPDRSDDLELDLDAEVAKYKAAKGEAGTRFGGSGDPVDSILSTWVAAIAKAFGVSVSDIVWGQNPWDPPAGGKEK